MIKKRKKAKTRFVICMPIGEIGQILSNVDGIPKFIDPVGKNYEDIRNYGFS